MIRWMFPLVVVSMLVSCRAGQAPVTTMVDLPEVTLPLDPTTGASQPSPTVAERVITPSVPLPGSLSPTLSITPTPQGISQEMDALIPPIPPAQLAVERRDEGNLLSWLGTGSDIDTHYIVYRRASANDTWQAIGYVAVVGDNRGAYSFLDDTADRPQMYAYSVSTINHYGKESSQTTIEMHSDP